MVESTSTEIATVLVVDDELSVLGLLAVLLKTTGYRVLASHDPGQALELCKHYPEPIHLLITDVLMPYMNGRELASQALVLRKDMRVIFISGYEHGVLTQGVGIQDDMAFLQKPFKPAALLQEVRKALGSVIAR
jgi:two-component system cell cycle sensor histidine kinase/response regulator CckA